MGTLLLTPEIDQRAGIGKIASRIGLEAEAQTFRQDYDLHALFATSEAGPALAGVACALIDEAQFLTRPHVEQLAQVSDDLDIPVLCYGLRTAFQGNLFPGRTALLGWADNLTELEIDLPLWEQGYDESPHR